jgi:hypothetical protein
MNRLHLGNQSGNVGNLEVLCTGGNAENRVQNTQSLVPWPEYFLFEQFFFFVLQPYSQQRHEVKYLQNSAGGRDRTAANVFSPGSSRHLSLLFNV